jgi:hypothetical protein
MSSCPMSVRSAFVDTMDCALLASSGFSVLGAEPTVVLFLPRSSGATTDAAAVAAGPPL